MKETHYLTLEECYTLHEKLIGRFGGSEGVRDPGLLESALARPRSGYYRSLSEQAAALMQSLASNHCFIDGNKRMAFAAPAIFLLMNGYHLEVKAEEGERFLIKTVIAGKADIKEMAAWIESKMRPSIKEAYEGLSKRHRKSRDKLGR